MHRDAILGGQILSRTEQPLCLKLVEMHSDQEINN